MNSTGNEKCLGCKDDVADWKLCAACFAGPYCVDCLDDHYTFRHTKGEGHAEEKEAPEAESAPGVLGGATGTNHSGAPESPVEKQEVTE